MNNKINYNKTVTGCLLALVLTFATLYPGGPVENRDFSNLAPGVATQFNIFLITLGIVGLISAFFSWKGKSWAYITAIAVGWLFVFVVALDLGKVFPVSPDQTGLLLGIIMILDAILALYVVLFSHKALGHL